MSTSAVELEIPDAIDVKVSDDTLSVELSDGRTISVPLDWYPRLTHATEAERNNWRIIGRGHGIHWEDIDEDISVEGLLAGRPSGESQSSFKKWLESKIVFKYSDPSIPENTDSGYSESEEMTWLERLTSIELPESIKNNAITAIAKGIGGLIESGLNLPKAYLDGLTAKIQAKYDAELNIITAAGKSAANLIAENPELGERALARYGKEIYQQQLNRESIAWKTFEELEHTVTTTESVDAIDPDWLTLFWKTAQIKSNEEIQRYFAKLLASEISAPSSISPHTLLILSVLTGGLAKSFESLCNISIDDGHWAFVVHPDVMAFQTIGSLESYSVSYDDLFDLDGAGLIRSAEALYLNFKGDDGGPLADVEYAGSPAGLRLAGHAAYLIQFTKAGRELRRLVDKQRIQAYTDALINNLGGDFDPRDT